MLIAETNRLSRPMIRRHPLNEIQRSISFFIKKSVRARRARLIKAELKRLAETSPHLLDDIGLAGEAVTGRAVPKSGAENLDEILKD